MTLGKVQGRVVRHLEDGFADRIHATAASRLSRRRYERSLTLIVVAAAARLKSLHAARKFATNVRTMSSFSTCGTCPQSLMISTRELAMPAANSLA